MRWDLHIHSSASDGSLSPEEVVIRAFSLGLDGIAITDHDNVSGVNSAQLKGYDLGIKVISGVEISTLYKDVEIHLLGYGMNINDHLFQSRLLKQRTRRNERNGLLIHKLKEFDIDIIEDINMLQEKTDIQIGRLHIAKAMVKRGFVKTVREAFDVYIGAQGIAYTDEPKTVAVSRAIDWIKEAGGLAVLAHPGIYKVDWYNADWISRLWGIETNHPDHTVIMTDELKLFSHERGLFATAGSDFHGLQDGKPFHADIGTCTVDESELNLCEIFDL